MLRCLELIVAKYRWLSKLHYYKTKDSPIGNRFSNIILHFTTWLLPPPMPILGPPLRFPTIPRRPPIVIPLPKLLKLAAAMPNATARTKVTGRNIATNNVELEAQYNFRWKRRLAKQFRAKQNNARWHSLLSKRPGDTTVHSAKTVVSWVRRDSDIWRRRTVG